MAIGNLEHSTCDCPPESAKSVKFSCETVPNVRSPGYPGHALDSKGEKDTSHGDRYESWLEDGRVLHRYDGMGEAKGYGVGLFGGVGVVFDEGIGSYPATYRGDVGYEIRLLLGEVDKSTRARLKKRSWEILKCGSWVSVRSCDCCGEDRDGSGSFAGARRTCKLTVCPTCGWVRSKKVGEFYQRAAEEISGGDGYDWQFLTVTTRYNPRSKEDLTWQALRHRARLVSRVVSKLWTKALKAEHAAMFRTIECSVRGHVHAHLLYYGPKVDEKALTDLAQKLCGDEVGYIHKRDISAGDDDGNELPTRVARAARYMAKGTSAYGSDFDEEHHGYEGRSVKIMDPRLAARWEVATTRMHLAQRYGALRGVDYSRSDYSYEPPDDRKVACEHCGTVGEWHDEIRKSEIWIQDCHDRGHKALVSGSSWIPYHQRYRAPP